MRKVEGLRVMNAAFSYHNGVVICVQHYAKGYKSEL
ncbi:hypothetical protein ANAPC1_00706 [Anaplasma phagocytophilum]|uniref:Uncharacterized protein n=3 Tax=Anaplasma phagocytophilum TaxID=948 RepID=A0AA45UT10_ANAPH|nr:hypothetical protein APH_0845 [Anaplasma phagocytophilum str. HZ]AGR80765.1 hypothetical protein WSQ_03915 [Anaplasma phagocytophilum str. JM]AGR82017.1 hypothetical protein YYY_03905 [Anaplasma phagocytophilum str. Dog2]EOA61116.1 hypothetical protein HGE1_03647 [Anaplasma phagocytophilum str. HGE1]EOA62309.1 hypothetical protein CRT38_03547 [Anaplasma phagocytophilum str. CRT38]SBO14356.1 hypothetical protein ANAPC1_00706 [Anaplasma phagocytophilum]